MMEKVNSGGCGQKRVVEGLINNMDKMMVDCEGTIAYGSHW